MSVKTRVFRVVLASFMTAVFALSAPSMGAMAKGAGNYMKKHDLRTNLKETKEVTVQSYCYGVGLRDSKVRILSIDKEDSSGVDDYEVTCIKVRISTPKLSSKKVKKAVKASDEAGLGKAISSSYYAVIMDGNTGKNLSVVASNEDEIDGVYSYVSMEYDGYYEQKAAGYEIIGYKDLIYTFVVAYPKSKTNLYVGIAGEKNPDGYSHVDFETGSKKFSKTNMYDKKNNKLSTFYKLN